MSEAQLVIVVLMLLIMFFSFSLVVVVAVVSARGTLEVISKVFKKFADTLGSKR